MPFRQALLTRFQAEILGGIKMALYDIPLIFLTLLNEFLRGILKKKQETC